jgi:N-ethylmaleimide reductase
MTSLFDSVRIGAMTIPNRIVMAPMTRNRADANGDPNEMMARYYAQRASFGLIITEGTQPALVGQAYPNTPGIINDSQKDGWREVALRVHDSGGHIFMQLMHSGRIGHFAVTGIQPVGPSSITPKGEVFTGKGLLPFQVPRAMDQTAIEDAISSFVQSARRAIDTGMDGVELHAANGYLLHQFLADNANHRDDSYGGSPEKRARFVIEATRAVAVEVGPARVGIRISPGGTFNDIAESEIEATYISLINGISDLGLAYLHVVSQPAFDGIAFAREHWSGPLIINTGNGDPDKVATAQHLVESGVADLVSFGRLALANPDLSERIREGTVLNLPDEKTFYSGGSVGYLDYQPLPR